MKHYFYIYQVTNTINGCIYIGCHKTKNLNDGYMGSGSVLTQAFNKHGIENFTKDILYFADNEEEMYEMERELVNEEFIARDDVYNLVLGGRGGGGELIKEKKRELWKDPAFRAKMKAITNSEEYKVKMSQSLKLRWQDSELRAQRSELSSNAWQDSAYRERVISSRKKVFSSPEFKEKHKEMLEKRWANPEFKEKTLESKKKAGSNSEFRERMSSIVKDKIYIHSLKEKRNRRIHRDEIIPEGWFKGRLPRN